MPAATMTDCPLGLRRAGGVTGNVHF